jgi:predicted nuclease with TOPRIM domain
MAQEEVESLNFYNSILEQTIEQLNNQISNDRLNQNEQLASKAKKYKSEIKRLELEKASYEERAALMCTQMTSQMTLLQTTAMKRIEVVFILS